MIAVSGNKYESIIERSRKAVAESIVTGYRLSADELCIVALDDKVKSLQKHLERMYIKLDNGSLHSIFCNGDHNSMVGGDSCSCALGKEIKSLRAEVVSLDKSVKSGQLCLSCRHLRSDEYDVWCDGDDVCHYHDRHEPKKEIGDE